MINKEKQAIERFSQNKPLTIKPLLTLSLAMLISLFSLQSYASEAEPLNNPETEQVGIDEDAMLPDEEALDEETGPETEPGEKPEADKPLSRADETDAGSDEENDSEKPENTRMMFG